MTGAEALPTITADPAHLPASGLQRLWRLSLIHI